MSINNTVQPFIIQTMVMKLSEKESIQFSFHNLNELIIQVNWDSGSNLGLIAGKDSYEVIKE